VAGCETNIKSEQSNMDYNIKISSLPEMSTYLNKLQQDSSNAVAEAIKAQLAIVTFIQSPTLNDTLFDTLLIRLDNSISLAQSDSEISNLRRIFSLMIQNYIFFLDAKIEYDVNQHKEEAYKLLKHAAKLLAESVVEITKLVATEGESFVNCFVENLLEKQGEKESFFQKVVGWFTQEACIRDKKAVFYNTIEGLYKKFDEYNNKIGPSIAIKGMLDRYAEPLSDFKFNEKITSIDNEKESHGCLSTIVGILVFIIGIITVVIRGIWRLIKGIDMDFSWLLSHCLWVLGITIACVLIKQIIFFFIFDFRIMILERQKKNYSKKLHKIANKYKPS